VTARAALPFFCLLGCLTGCDAVTSAVIHLTFDGENPPSAIRVRAFSPTAELTREPLPTLPVSLPGDLKIAGLPPVSQDVRVVVLDDTEPLGGVTVAVRAREEVRADLLLARNVPDRDRDGIPDVVDNCPDDANPSQADVCGARPDLAPGLADGAVTDLAPGDLADGAVACPHLLCEDFEAATLDATRWETILDGQSIDLDANRGRAPGSRSLRFTVSLPTGSGRFFPRIKLSDSFPRNARIRGAQSLFVRFYAQMSPGPSALRQTETSLFGLFYNTELFELFGDSNGLGFEPRGGVTTFDLARPNTDPVQWVGATEWRCVVARIDTSLDGGLPRRLNASGRIDNNVDRALFAGEALYTVSEVVFGPDVEFDPTTANRQFQLWLDDITIDDQPLTCP
jgi:hypothetical protein